MLRSKVVTIVLEWLVVQAVVNGGFSFQGEGPLDMCMDMRTSLTGGQGVK